MRDFLTKISSTAFSAALLGSVILYPEVWIKWGIRIGVCALLIAFGWEIATSVKES